MNANWYDLLDVERDATDARIRTAWKSAIADLDPTDRRFRVYNQAAEVLLDPARRATYDAELAATERADAARDEAEGRPDRPGPVVVDGADVPPTHEPARRRWLRGSKPAASEAPRQGRTLVPAWLLIGLALVVAILVATSAVLWFRDPTDASVEDSTRAAQSAAERAVVPVLSYDAQHLDEDQQAAESYLTPAYRKQYDQLFEVIKQNAPATQTVVKADVIASGVVRSGSDRVDILLFVDRPTTNKVQKQPLVYKDQVTLTMQKVGNDWLVDNMVTSPVSQ